LYPPGGFCNRHRTLVQAGAIVGTLTQPTPNFMTHSSDPIWDGLPAIRLRAVVKGASSTVVVAPAGGSRTHQTYAWWLETLLEAAGLPSTVRNAGSEAQKITMALCNWEREIQQWAPDVVILNYGQYECMPGILPRWLQRQAAGWHRHSGVLRDQYRQRILEPVWQNLTRYQKRWYELLNPGPFRTSPKRTVAELRRLVEVTRTVGTPLILVMDTWPLATRWQKWFPGMQERIVQLRGEVSAWLDEAGDSELRLFRLSEIVGRHDVDEALPDGVHFSAPHLQHPTLNPGFFDQPR
jgi:hypothetical protein